MDFHIYPYWTVSETKDIIEKWVISKFRKYIFLKSVLYKYFYKYTGTLITRYKFLKTMCFKFLLSAS